MLVGSPYLHLAHRNQGWRLPIVSVVSARCDSGQVARRQAEVLVRSRDMPTGQRWLGMVAEAGVSLADGSGGEDVPQLVGRLRSVPRDAERGLVRIALASPELSIHGHGFVRPRTIAGGAIGALQALVWEALPGHRVAVGEGVTDVPLQVTTYEPGDDARWKAVSEIAAAMSAELGSDRGGRLRLAHVDQPWAPGSAPVVLAVGSSTDRAPQAESDVTPNVIRVVSTGKPEGDDETPYGVAVDDRPYSPGYVGPHIRQGLIQRGDETYLRAAAEWPPLVVETFELPVLSWLDAAAAARALVKRKSRSGDVTLAMPCNPWLDWGDRVVGLTDDDRAGEAYVVTGFDIPLALSPVMQVTARLA